MSRKKDSLATIRDGIVKMMKSGLIFTNSKTDISIELGVCPLMVRGTNEKGNPTYASPVCPSCYAKILLCVYPGTRNKLESIPEDKSHLMDSFIQDLQLLKILGESQLGGLDRIRFYGISDFKPNNIPFIIETSKVFVCDIISKTLTLPTNEQYLRKLINTPNVWISLSFNKDWKNELPRIKRILLETKAKNVQLNYCLHTKEENPTDEWYDQFQVIHQRDKNNMNAVNLGVDPSRVCCIIDRDGNPTNSHGHCKNCDKCHVSFLENIKWHSLSNIRMNSHHTQCLLIASHLRWLLLKT